MLSFRTKATCLAALAAASTAAIAIPAKHIPILSEGKTDKDWRAAAEPAPAYPSDANAGDVCVNIGFLIESDGVPGQFAHLKSWSAASARDRKAREELAVFEQTAVAVLQARRYQPVDAQRAQAVYTSQTFVFSNTPGSDTERLRKRCTIRDLDSFIATAMKNADMNSWEQIRWNGEWFHAKTRAHGLNRE